ncbi:hypothetical protein FACS1894202_13720 [Clostridia bacterium]|nr:hypothetical protein FACS1894202_13720 [Clostridia bacterium]
MHAYEFNSRVVDNAITIPEMYRGKIGSDVRVIVLSEEIPFYSEANMKALKKSVQEGREGKFITKTLEELDAYAD